MTLQDRLSEVLISDIGCKTITKFSSVGGGCINKAYKFDTDKGSYFVKVNDSEDSQQMFSAEMEGLKALAETRQIRVPVPYYVGSTEKDESFLIMEHIELCSPSKQTEQKLGNQLAHMHIHGLQSRFGFHVNNTIGSTPQNNTWDDDWIRFYSKRLEYQLSLIQQEYSDTELISYGKKLIDQLPHFFEGLVIKPSLIHGDLWSGNWAADKQGNPVIYDPAPYFAHHEAELSIMTMFGGFGSGFWEEYHKVIPKESGFQERHSLYQLYHYLNHYNLFGSGYKGSCMNILRKIVNKN